MLGKLSNLFNTTVITLGIFASYVNSNEIFYYNSTIPQYYSYNNTMYMNNSIDNNYLSSNQEIIPYTNNNNTVFYSNAQKEVDHLTNLLTNLYDTINQNNITIEQKNNCVKQFWNAIFDKDFNSLNILFNYGSLDNLNSINNMLNIPEVRRYNELSKSEYWKKHVSTLTTLKEQCIDGTNVQIDYSVDENTAKDKFKNDYYDFFDKYYQEFLEYPQYEFEQEFYNNKIRFNEILYRLNNSPNYEYAKTIIYNLCNILKENMPINRINEVKGDWDSVFKKAWIEQRQDDAKK